METRAIYDVSGQQQIRPTCLVPFASGWTPPTAAEIHAVINKTGLSGSEVARLVGVSGGRTVRRWTGGEVDIPYAVWAMLCEQAGYGRIWK